MSRIAGVVMLLALLWPLAVFAEGEIGVIKTAVGEVYIVRGEASMNGVVGTTLLVQDILKTGPEGAIGVVMNDDTTFITGPWKRTCFKGILIRAKRKFFFGCAKDDQGYIHLHVRSHR